MLYATFWQRLGALLLDSVCYVPILLLSMLISSNGRHLYLACAGLGVLINVWFYIYLVRRFGGTPGKLMMGLQIVKVDGSPLSYREAVLRNIVELSLTVFVSTALSIGAMRMTDAEYLSLGWQQRFAEQLSLSPGWYVWADALFRIWNLSLLIVMLANKKRRTSHDFLAGTAVVKRVRDKPFISTDVTA
ncbi:RDD family protein [Dyella solisilvae]|uniref:RDD family protein n=1 Tax=Dyella solisilvae TaxID=1920168 RepID=A0A370K7X7_9GAMM|nr:RDD family protein [Dyella solisilvae]RDI98752.1 RDD family protein [Dyella solisilvae]